MLPDNPLNHIFLENYETGIKRIPVGLEGTVRKKIKPYPNNRGCLNRHSSGGVS
jgi:hypothetical protein